MEQFQFAPKLAMVTFPGFFQPLKVLVEFCSRFESRAINALQLRIIGIPFVISACDRSEFEGADVPCPHHVRTRTKIREVSVAIQRNFFVVRYSLQNIELELARGDPGSECTQSTFFCQFEGLLASEHNLL